jgi:glycosyltransferase involved in cell wall biosynthesis
MYNKPLVSILVPICNVEKFLDKCLSSLSNQTLKNIEIICINDGSKDRSLDIIKKYADKDKRFKIIDKSNSGYGDSMNKGLELASGQYIGIVESDDFASPDMFESLYKIALNKDADIVRSNFFFYWTDRPEIKFQQKEFTHYNEVTNCLAHPEILKFPPAIWSSIYKREFLVKNKISFLPTPGASYQDTSFFIKAFVAADKIYFLEEGYLHYRQDNSNSSVKQCGLEKVMLVHREFEEADNFLANVPENKRTSIKYEYALKKINTYFWNLYRVDYKIKYARKLRPYLMELNDSLNYIENNVSKFQQIVLWSIFYKHFELLKILLFIRMCKKKLW